MGSLSAATMTEIRRVLVNRFHNLPNHTGKEDDEDNRCIICETQPSVESNFDYDGVCSSCRLNSYDGM